jgi:hypothetical protein
VPKQSLGTRVDPDLRAQVELGREKSGCPPVAAHGHIVMKNNEKLLPWKG